MLRTYIRNRLQVQNIRFDRPHCNTLAEKCQGTVGSDLDLRPCQCGGPLVDVISARVSHPLRHRLQHYLVGTNDHHANFQVISVP